MSELSDARIAGRTIEVARERVAFGPVRFGRTIGVSSFPSVEVWAEQSQFEREDVEKMQTD